MVKKIGTGASERVNRMVNGTSFTMGPIAGLGASRGGLVGMSWVDRSKGIKMVE